MVCEAGCLTRVPPDYARLFDRQPFGFEHGLSGLELFSDAALRELCRRYDRDFFVAAGAEGPDTAFYSVPSGVATPAQAYDTLDTTSQRILLKGPEQYDVRYADLLKALFEEVVGLRGGLEGARLVRLVSSILISSAATITPFHFDPETSFFFQICGDKIYHLYRPDVLSEEELERFYVKGVVNIGQVDFEGRDPEREFVFPLEAGKGLHQPQNCPHWVETQSTRSISYVFSYETDVSRARGRTRAFNHYLRAWGLRPPAPGRQPATDARKAEAMRLIFPLRKSASRIGRTLRQRGR